MAAVDLEAMLAQFQEQISAQLVVAFTEGENRDLTRRTIDAVRSLVTSLGELDEDGICALVLVDKCLQAIVRYVSPLPPDDEQDRIISRRLSLARIMAALSGDAGGDLVSLRAELSHAAELLGGAPANYAGSSERGNVIDSLIRISRSESSVVREGAVYGLGEHAMTDERARARLFEMLEDEREGVREAASEALSELGVGSGE